MDNEIFQLRLTIKDLLVNMCARIDGIVEMYALGEYSKANERITFFVDDMTVLLEGLNILKEHQMEINWEDLNLKLKNILNQFDNEDYLFVSDLLKYELKPLLELWQEEINYEQ